MARLGEGEYKENSNKVEINKKWFTNETKR
jgi:hypothetical protein